MNKLNIFLMLVVVFLLGVFVARGFNDATADVAGSAPGTEAFLTNFGNENSDILYVIEPNSQRILAYQYRVGVLYLVGARDYKWDKTMQDSAALNNNMARKGLSAYEVQKLLGQK